MTFRTENSTASFDHHPKFSNCELLTSTFLGGDEGI